MVVKKRPYPLWTSEGCGHTWATPNPWATPLRLLTQENYVTRPNPYVIRSPYPSVTNSPRPRASTSLVQREQRWISSACRLNGGFSSVSDHERIKMKKLDGWRVETPASVGGVSHFGKLNRDVTLASQSRQIQGMLSMSSLRIKQRSAIAFFPLYRHK